MPVQSNSQFIDVGFDVAVPSDQALGAIMEPPDEMLLRAPAGSYSAYASEIYDRRDWPDLAKERNPRLRQCIRNVKSQGSEGSCVFNAEAGIFEFCSVQQYGWDADHRIISAIIGYSIHGSSPGSGSYVGDAVKFGVETGHIVEEGHGYPEKYQFKATGFSDARRWRANNPQWKDEAAENLILEWYKVQSVEEWATALFNGHPIIKGRKGHSIFDFIWDHDAAMKWYGGYCNSWGPWGDPINEVVGKGLGWDSEKLIGSLVGWAAVGVKRKKLQPQPAIAT